MDRFLTSCSARGASRCIVDQGAAEVEPCAEPVLAEDQATDSAQQAFLVADRKLDVIVINFKVECHTELGEEVFLVGSASGLGNWDFGRAVRLTTSPAQYPTWSSPAIQVLAAEAGNLEYKYIQAKLPYEKSGECCAIWEGGANRWIEKEKLMQFLFCTVVDVMDFQFSCKARSASKCVLDPYAAEVARCAEQLRLEEKARIHAQQALFLAEQKLESAAQLSAQSEAEVLRLSSHVSEVMTRHESFKALSKGIEIELRMDHDAELVGLQSELEAAKAKALKHQRIHDTEMTLLHSEVEATTAEKLELQLAKDAEISLLLSEVNVTKVEKEELQTHYDATTQALHSEFGVEMERLRSELECMKAESLEHHRVRDTDMDLMCSEVEAATMEKLEVEDTMTAMMANLRSELEATKAENLQLQEVVQRMAEQHEAEASHFSCELLDAKAEKPLRQASFDAKTACLGAALEASREELAQAESKLAQNREEVNSHAQKLANRLQHFKECREEQMEKSQSRRQLMSLASSRQESLGQISSSSSMSNLSGLSGIATSSGKALLKLVESEQNPHDIAVGA